MAGSGAVVRCEGVGKRYWRRTGHGLNHLLSYLLGAVRSRAELWALRGVSFELARGESIGVVGPNGTGKSTLLKLLASVTMPSAGRVETHGRVAALLELGAGFHPELTGRENIALNAAVLGMSRREIAERFDRIVEFSGLAEHLDAPIKHYSSGMTARLGFAIAVHTDPDVLLADEVLAVGDAAYQRTCLERIASLRESGMAMVLVSHDMAQVREVCDRAVFLRGGEVVEQGQPDAVCAAYEASLQPA